MFFPGCRDDGRLGHGFLLGESEEVSRSVSAAGRWAHRTDTKIGDTQWMVSCYESERIRIPAGMLLKIADVLKVSVYELLGRASSGRAPRDKKLWKVLEKLEALAPRDQKVVLRTIDALARASG